MCCVMRRLLSICKHFSILIDREDRNDADVRKETPVMPETPVSSDVILPPFLRSALISQDPQFKSQGKNKLKNALIQALFDHLSQKTM